jgi:two-component system, cell cycle response regulator DivK
LIVEDNALVAKFFRMALERAGGCSCMISEDVPEILNLAASGDLDLVLLDVSLTNSEWNGEAINGVQLCRMVKEKSPRRLPVLLATAHAMSGDRERLLETSGADGYLEKPVYDSALLVEKVRSLIDPA